MTGNGQHGQDKQYSREMSANESMSLGSEFELHPEGEYIGKITKVEDLGLCPTNFGVKPKMRITITCMNASAPKREDGERHRATRRLNVAGGTQATLSAFRAAALGRKLRREELWDFKTSDLLDRLVNYEIEHVDNPDGEQPYVNIESVTKLTKAQRDALAGVGQAQESEAKRIAEEEAAAEEQRKAESKSGYGNESAKDDPVADGLGDDLPF